VRRESIDYAAEARRSRLAQGLEPHIPQHLRDAVAKLLAAWDRGQSEGPGKQSSND
jgi:hypothetical protein